MFNFKRTGNTFALCVLAAVLTIFMAFVFRYKDNSMLSVGPGTRIVLVGKTGSGKSTTGNMILGETVFDARLSGISHTKHSSRAHAFRFGRDRFVVDTPGLFDTHTSDEETLKEVAESVELAFPGPHAIVVVMHIGRYTEEEQQALNTLRTVFGDELTKYAIVVFKRKLDLDNENKTIDDYVKHDIPLSFQMFLEKCSNRYIAISRDTRVAEKHARELLKMADRLLQSNNGTYYSYKMLMAAKKADDKKRRREAEIAEGERRRVEEKRQREKALQKKELEEEKRKSQRIKQNLERVKNSRRQRVDDYDFEWEDDFDYE